MEVEPTFLRVPYECLKRVVKDRGATVNEELGRFAAGLAACAAAAGNAGAAASALVLSSGSGVLSRLDDLLLDLQGLKRKLEAASEQEAQTAARVRARVAHLGTNLSAKAGDAAAVAAYRATRLDRAVVDALLRAGYFDSASRLAEALGIRDLVDADVFLEARAVVAALRSRDAGPALAWCATHRPKLKKARSRLEFRLRAQQFVELVRARDQAGAISHAKAHLAPWAATQLAEFQRVIAVLAFGPGTRCAAYAPLFAADRWELLVEEFLKEAYRMHSLTAEPMLHTYLQAGLAALKTPHSLLPDCPREDPLRDEGLRALAAGLPFAKHVHSKLVCALSRELMNEHNPPMVLPNGHVYSKKALEEMARLNSGKITCPRTGLVCDVSELSKAYIM